MGKKRTKKDSPEEEKELTATEKQNNEPESTLELNNKKNNDGKNKKKGKENIEKVEGDDKSCIEEKVIKEKIRTKDRKNKQDCKEKESEDQKSSKSNEQGLVGEEKIILEYMLSKNRPFNALNVHDNLAGSIKKPLVIKILDKLTDIGKLQAKDFGKNKIYLANQALIPIGDEDELLKLDSEIKSFGEEADQLKKEVKNLQAKAKELENSLSLEEIMKLINEKKENLAIVNKEIEELRTAGCVSASEKSEIEAKLKLTQSEEKKRQKTFNDLVSILSESLDENKKKIKEMIGIEE